MQPDSFKQNMFHTSACVWRIRLFNHASLLPPQILPRLNQRKKRLNILLERFLQFERVTLITSRYPSASTENGYLHQSHTSCRENGTTPNADQAILKVNWFQKPNCPKRIRPRCLTSPFLSKNCCSGLHVTFFVTFFRPMPSWLSPGRYTRSTAAKRWIVNYHARPSMRR